MLAEAQTPKEHEFTHYVDSANRYYTQASLPIYVMISHKPDMSDATPLAKLDKTKNTNKVEPFYLDGPGMHILKHYDQIDHRDDRFIIYADGEAPSSVSHFEGAERYKDTNGTVYYGPGLNVTLSTEDDMVGVAKVFHSINEKEYTPYQETISFEQEGNISFKYYGVDHVGNASAPKEEEFVIDTSSPNTYHVINGISIDNIISVSSKVFLLSGDSLSGVKEVWMRFDDEEFVQYNTKEPIATARLEDGEHVLEYYAIDHVGNKEEVTSFDFYLDKTAPITAADVLGDRYVVDGEMFFSGRSKLKLTAVDNKAGVRAIMYSIDGQEFQKYENPFYLPSVAGKHSVSFYSIDNLANEVTEKEMMYNQYLHNVSKVYLDLTGPTLSYGFEGDTFMKDDTLYISEKTGVRLNATDPESGMQYIAYSFNQEIDEITYESPLHLKKEGAYQLNIYGYDNVNNRNVKRGTFAVDNTGPEVFVHYSIDPIVDENGQEYYPSYTSVFLAATDKLTGYKAMYYKVNGKAERPYTGVIDGFRNNRTYEIEVRALDKLSNETYYKFSFKTSKRSLEKEVVN
ncbi:hypothetical protein GCM10023331_01240 [Algivirga pacifica]|uniref:Ig-like domain-containing protein n=1 Tax=Algivirga pacifica TaxID=1162670 RepID=A0ABP9CZT8_9BACT